MEPDGKIDPNKLEEWITKARLDPNDPENEVQSLDCRMQRLQTLETAIYVIQSRGQNHFAAIALAKFPWGAISVAHNMCGKSNYF